MRVFVWVRNLFGPPSAQIDHGETIGSNGKPSYEALQEPVALADNDERTLDQLRKDYPLPEPPG